MKVLILQTLLCLVSKNFVSGLSSEEVFEVQDTCCSYGESFAVTAPSVESCSSAGLPEDIKLEQVDTCLPAMQACCMEHFKKKDDCASGLKLAVKKLCAVPKTEIGKTCCEECSFGRWTGESQGKEACGEPSDDDVSPTTALRKNAYYQCCKEAAEIAELTTTPKPTTTTPKPTTTTPKPTTTTPKPTTTTPKPTTTTPKPTTTTPKPTTTTPKLTTTTPKPTTTTSKPTTTTRKPTTTKKVKEKCKKDSCQHVCNDSDGKIKCSCHDGFRLQPDQKSCKDINECAEAIDDLCTREGTVCHNTRGSYKCVPIRNEKRDVGITCPPGFKRNVENQVCDDINECQLPRPPCPKYLCENTIGAYKCAGKLGKPLSEDTPGLVTEAVASSTSKNEICPPGFRSGPNDECIDIDECEETLDDCQRLSQHCINTHGSFFCQDHVSKRCAPGFKVNVTTGICEDIDECEESTEVCKRSEICVNLPGAYNCKSKISTLPKLAPRTSCQSGTRMKLGGTTCEDIDECREGTHLCDQFQNCINTFGGFECRCKNGFEMDSSSGSCVDIDECALKLDNCGPDRHCLNVLGSFTCRRTQPTTSTTAAPLYEYEYYDSDEEENGTNSQPPTTSSTTTTTSTTKRPTTSTTSTTTPTSTVPPYRPRSRFTSTTTRKPLTNKPQERTRPPYRPYHKPSTTLRPSSTLPPIVTVPTPDETTVIEVDKDPEGTYSVNANDIPKDRWTNVIGKERPEDTIVDYNKIQCEDGYDKDAHGNCIDINECAINRHTCSALEVCVNRAGGFQCQCIAGYRRDSSGWCRPVTTSSTTVRTTSTSTSSTTTEGWSWSPWTTPRPRRPYAPPIICELGYKFETDLGKCVDIDECANNKATCSTDEDCVNVEGGFRCECGRRCRTDRDRNTYVPSSLPRAPLDPNVITVGAQYGQRGPRYLRPSFSRLSGSGAVVATCPWGYKLLPDKRCLDIDECARNISECGTEQRCENFYGGYSCQCPAGHRLVESDRCEDVDECRYGTPCSYNSNCINTVGSYRCECGEGFRNAPTNDKVCVDVDECAERPGVCHHRCANAWGGYRCYCERGYRLDNDSRTCVDIDECFEYASSRVRGRLCAGQCVNEPGSYRCTCPSGYRLSDDGASCVDIDECETGMASCAHGEPGMVCQNTRGGYHCHRISCPSGYRLEGKHRCSRIQRSCPVSDWDCLNQPSAYSYNFITFVSNIYLPSGRVDLFTMHGPSWSDARVDFDMKLVDAQGSAGVNPAGLSCFDMQQRGSSCVISLLCSLVGPQVTELELTMSVHRRHQFAGRAAARLVVIVSQYEF